MDAMRLALLFNRVDVDAFIEEMDAETYAEWLAFLSLEPQGWQADRIGIQRLSFMMALSAGSKNAKERDFAIDIGENLRSEEAERARWEALSIRKGIEAQAAERKKKAKH